MCVACRKVVLQTSLVRVAVCPSEPWLRLDMTRRLGGRGFYVHPLARCVAGLRRGPVRAKIAVDDQQVAVAFQSVRDEIGRQLSEISISSTEKSKNVVDHRSEDASV
ncbi:MAG: YlxR family protein [Kofleriaceae bacterium]|nr:YlxR family protein [Kofleriaceae bacterium]